MKKSYNVQRYVKLVSHSVRRVLAFVNVFKKKNCGASPLNGENTSTFEKEFDTRFSFMKKFTSAEDYNSTRLYFCLKKYLSL